MNIITISLKYQIVIPKNIRKKLNIKPGQKFQVLEYKGRIELIPQKDISELRGFVKGINTESIREKDRI